MNAGEQVRDNGEVGEREQRFWNEHAPPLQRCIWEYERGPDANTRAMLDAAEPLAGARVLDFACGAGVTSAFLASRGAIVTAIDISPVSIERARELARHAGLQIELIAGELRPGTFAPESFDAIIGRYALHHVDLSQIAPIFKEILRPGGRCSCLETMGVNPLLRLARRRLAGRAGVASYGSDDERPLERADLAVLAAHLGPVELITGQLNMLRIFDRNVLRFRHRRISRWLGAVDDALLGLGLGRLSYHQVVRATRPASAATAAPPA